MRMKNKPFKWGIKDMTYGDIVHYRDLHRKFNMHELLENFEWTEIASRDVESVLIHKMMIL